MPTFEPSKEFTIHNSQFTILIPARNEAANIEKCLASLSTQTLLPGEIFVIDDHSTDQTAAIVEQFSKKNPHLNISLLRLEGKKMGKKTLEMGIEASGGTYIICTDADCAAGPNWLQLMLNFALETDAVAVTAPVAFHYDSSILSRFQALDLMGLMGVTGAMPSLGMGNEANFLYKKEAFLAVGGFAGFEGIASGDDMFLIQKLQRAFPNKVKFLKNPDVTVYTDPAPTWKKFLQQRIRWGGKSRHFPNRRTTVILGLMWLSCLLMLVNFFLGIFLSPFFFLIFGIQFFVKSFADYFFLSEMARLFSRPALVSPLNFLRSAFVHPIYIAVVGLLANVSKKYEWKERSY